MTGIQPLHNIHAGGTMLIVGNGGNLHLTPPELFDYPAIGMNTIHLYEGWKPDYYVAVDKRNWYEFGGDIAEKFKDIPKIVASPRLDKWQGDNFYRFRHDPGPLWNPRKGRLWQDDIGNARVTYSNCMHVAIKLAYYMGAETILIVGMEHRPHDGQTHFWGLDKQSNIDDPLTEWFEGYRQLREGLNRNGVQIYNVSQDTCVPGEIIPQDDWENWAISPNKE